MKTDYGKCVGNIGSPAVPPSSHRLCPGCKRRAAVWMVKTPDNLIGGVHYHCRACGWMAYVPPRVEG